MESDSIRPIHNEHVIIVARYYWPKPGAATVRLQNLANEWRGRGATVTVLTVKSVELPVRTVGPIGETVIPLHGDQDTRFGISRIARLILFAIEAWWILRKLAPTLVISDPPPTSGLAARFSSAQVNTYYIADSWAEMLRETGGKLPQIVGRLVEPLERYVLRKAGLVIAVRENLAEFARKSGSQNVLVAPYGTDLVAFKDEGEIWNDPWEGSKPYFVYAGNYGHMHGATIFLEAAELLWKRNLSVGVVFVGYGSDQQHVDEFAKRHPKNFVAIAPSPPEYVAAINRGALGALASLRPIKVSSQTRPAKALAAIACGCPVIFAGEGSFAREVDLHRLGISTPWDPTAISDAMVSLLSKSGTDPSDYKKWRKQLVQYAVKNFDMSQTSKILANRMAALL